MYYVLCKKMQFKLTSTYKLYTIHCNAYKPIYYKLIFHSLTEG